jgi:hypothetical protein
MIRALILSLWLLAGPAGAAPDLCEAAARQAAAELGVPGDLMLAIALAETGRADGGRLRPWPWAANLEGAGHWFDTRAALVAFVEGAVAVGRTSVDIGCFQINWRWHGQHFSRPGDLSDPLTNARHAARFLVALHAELGSWEAATGAYHSRTPALAARYAARVASLRASTLAAAPPPPPRQPATGWAMPTAGPPAALASLIPGGTPPRPFLTGIAP